MIIAETHGISCSSYHDIYTPLHHQVTRRQRLPSRRTVRDKRRLTASGVETNEPPAKCGPDCYYEPMRFVWFDVTGCRIPLVVTDLQDSSNQCHQARRARYNMSWWVRGSVSATDVHKHAPCQRFCMTSVMNNQPIKMVGEHPKKYLFGHLFLGCSQGHQGTHSHIT